MNWKKLFLGIGIGFSLTSIIFSVAFSVNKAKFEKIDSNKQDDYFLVNIKGAVERAGKYKYKEPKTLKEIFEIAKLKKTADITSFNLNLKISKNFDIFVPYKKIENANKTFWQDVTYDFLIKNKISKKIAQKIMDFKITHLKTSWLELSKISGIGKTTLKRLQEIIIL